jgi:RimJ/RimL family protein N-acetyltransferase
MDPILRDIPEQIESQRLIIRAPRAGDSSVVNAAVLDSFEELRVWMPWAKEKPSVEESEVYVRGAYARFLTREELPMLMFEKESGDFVGGTGLHRLDWSIPKFEIGYWCRTSKTGRGYITEATYAIAEFAFLQLGARRVEIRADAQNVRSFKVPERLGFTLEGTLRSDSLTNAGEPSDTRVYAALTLEELKRP